MGFNLKGRGFWDLIAVVLESNLFIFINYFSQEIPSFIKETMLILLNLILNLRYKLILFQKIIFLEKMASFH